MHVRVISAEIDDSFFLLLDLPKGTEYSIPNESCLTADSFALAVDFRANDQV